MMRAPRVFRLFMVVVILFTSLSCRIPLLPDRTAKPKPTATILAGKEVVKPTATVKAVATATTAPANTPSGPAPEDLIKSATIMIEAQGSFVDPKDGQTGRAGSGSGFIIDPSGIAVTNNHVVTGAALLKVWVGGNKDKVYSAKVLGASECSDLAVIKIEGSDFPYLKWYDGQPKVGMQIFVAGFPLGDPEFTLTKGIISKANADGKTSWSSLGSVLEHDARTSPGTSGGPLVTEAGQVVGVHYAHNDANQYFAIPRAEVDKVLNQLKGGSDVTSIGVNGLAFITDDKKFSGIWVYSVKSGSPADKTGIKGGDFILTLEGVALSQDGTMADYCQILNSHKPTDPLSVTVRRWATQENLEGQINGRQLVKASGGSGQSDGPTPTNADDLVMVSDPEKVITAGAPSGWKYDDSPWESTWEIGRSSNPFIAQRLILAPDINAFRTTWGVGMSVTTSVDWGPLGGYANLMEGISGMPKYKECTPVTPKKVTVTLAEDYEGMEKLFKNCGPDKGMTMVYALRPVKNSQAYLLWIQIQYTDEKEQALMYKMMGTVKIHHKWN